MGSVCLLLGLELRLRHCLRPRLTILAAAAINLLSPGRHVAASSQHRSPLNPSTSLQPSQHAAPMSHHPDHALSSFLPPRAECPRIVCPARCRHVPCHPRRRSTAQLLTWTILRHHRRPTGSLLSAKAVATSRTPVYADNASACSHPICLARHLPYTLPPATSQPYLNHSTQSQTSDQFAFAVTSAVASAVPPPLLIRLPPPPNATASRYLPQPTVSAASVFAQIPLTSSEHANAIGGSASRYLPQPTVSAASVFAQIPLTSSEHANAISGSLCSILR